MDTSRVEARETIRKSDVGTALEWPTTKMRWGPKDNYRASCKYRIEWFGNALFYGAGPWGALVGMGSDANEASEGHFLLCYSRVLEALGFYDEASEKRLRASYVLGKICNRRTSEDEDSCEEEDRMSLGGALVDLGRGNEALGVFETLRDHNSYSRKLLGDIGIGEVFFLSGRLGDAFGHYLDAWDDCYRIRTESARSHIYENGDERMSRTQNVLPINCSIVPHRMAWCLARSGKRGGSYSLLLQARELALGEGTFIDRETILEDMKRLDSKREEKWRMADLYRDTTGITAVGRTRAIEGPAIRSRYPVIDSVIDTCSYPGVERNRGLEKPWAIKEIDAVRRILCESRQREAFSDYRMMVRLRVNALEICKKSMSGIEKQEDRLWTKLVCGGIAWSLGRGEQSWEENTEVENSGIQPMVALAQAQMGDILFGNQEWMNARDLYRKALRGLDREKGIIKLLAKTKDWINYRLAWCEFKMGRCFEVRKYSDTLKQGVGEAGGIIDKTILSEEIRRLGECSRYR